MPSLLPALLRNCTRRGRVGEKKEECEISVCQKHKVAKHANSDI